MPGFPPLKSPITRTPHLADPAGVSANATPKLSARGLALERGPSQFRVCCVAFRFPGLTLSILLIWEICPIPQKGLIKRQGWRLWENVSRGVIAGRVRSGVGLQEQVA